MRDAILAPIGAEHPGCPHRSNGMKSPDHRGAPTSGRGLLRAQPGQDQGCPTGPMGRQGRGGAAIPPTHWAKERTMNEVAQQLPPTSPAACEHELVIYPDAGHGGLFQNHRSTSRPPSSSSAARETGNVRTGRWVEDSAIDAPTHRRPSRALNREVTCRWAAATPSAGQSGAHGWDSWQPNGAGSGVGVPGRRNRPSDARGRAQHTGLG
jgi:hypothetical protein